MGVVIGGVIILMAILVVLEVWSVRKDTLDLEDRIRRIRRGDNGEEE
jgi:hypothetical protein